MNLRNRSRSERRGIETLEALLKRLAHRPLYQPFDPGEIDDVCLIQQTLECVGIELWQNIFPNSKDLREFYECRAQKRERADQQLSAPVMLFLIQDSRRSAPYVSFAIAQKRDHKRKQRNSYRHDARHSLEFQPSGAKAFLFIHIVYANIGVPRQQRYVEYSKPDLPDSLLFNGFEAVLVSPEFARP